MNTRILKAAALFLCFALNMGCSDSHSGSHLSAMSEADREIIKGEETLKIKMTAPLKQMFAKKDERKTFKLDIKTLEEDPPWAERGVTLQFGDKSAVSAKVRVRGSVSRGDSFPPLKYKLIEDAGEGFPLSSARPVKIITHSKEEGERQLIPIRSYILFKLFAKMSSYHFSPRFAEIHYLDADAKWDIKRPALLLEHEAVAASRQVGFSGTPKLSFLQQARMPAAKEKDEDVRDDFRYAMLQTLRLEVLEKRRAVLEKVRPKLSTKKIDTILIKERDALWIADGLPAWLKEEEEFLKLKPRLDREIEKRNKEILGAQAAIREQLDTDQWLRVVLFEMMIAHTDWELFGYRDFMREIPPHHVNLKNIKLITHIKTGKLYPLPYDFDNAAMYSNGAPALQAQYKKDLAHLFHKVDSDKNLKKRLTAILKSVTEKRAEFLEVLKDPRLGESDREHLRKVIPIFLDICASES